MEELLLEAAKIAAEKALKAMGSAAYRSGICQDPDRSRPTAFFCDLVGGATGAAVEQWREEVTRKLDEIRTELESIGKNVEVINQGVHELLIQTSLIHLELGKLLAGARAYQHLQDIQAYFDRYIEMLGRAGSALKSGRDALADSEWEEFFSDVIMRYRLPDKLDLVKTAVTESLLDANSLLHYFVREIVVLAGDNCSPDQLMRYYRTFETYVGSLLIEMQKGYLLQSHALLYFEMRKDLTKGQAAPPAPVSGAEWIARRDSDLRHVVESFNDEVIWLLITLSWSKVGESHPFFLLPGSREVVARASRFAVRALGEPYGLRGVILSMGDRFDGKVTLGAAALPTARKSAILTDQTDWWSTAATKGVYDTFAVSRSWNAFYYALPQAGAGTYPLPDIFPYATLPAEVAPIDEVTGKPPENPDASTVNFGSFIEIERAGGAFALLSGAWTKFESDIVTTHNSALQQGSDIHVAWSNIAPAPLLDRGRQVATTTALQLTLARGAEVFWSFGSLWGEQRYIRFLSRKTIMSPRGGRYKVEGQFHPLPAPAYVVYGEHGYGGPLWDHVSLERMIASNDDLRNLILRKLWYTHAPTTAYGCHIYLHVAVFLTKQKHIIEASVDGGAAVASWDVEVSASESKKDDTVIAAVPGYPIQGVFELEPSVPYHLVAQAYTEHVIETSGMDRTSFYAHMAGQFANVKITRALD